jgi:cyclohexanone monooxygenase
MNDSTGSDRRASGEFDPARLRQKYRQERDKRLRPDGNGQYLDVSGDYAKFAADPYLESSPGGRPREARFAEVDALVLGGGRAGLTTAARLDEAGVRDFLIVDQVGDFGGAQRGQPLGDLLVHGARSRLGSSVIHADHLTNYAARLTIWAA